MEIEIHMTPTIDVKTTIAATIPAHHSNKLLQYRFKTIKNPNTKERDPNTAKGDFGRISAWPYTVSSRQYKESSHYPAGGMIIWTTP